MKASTKYNRMNNTFVTTINLVDMTLTEYELLYNWSLQTVNSLKLLYNDQTIGETFHILLASRTLTLKWRFDPTWIGYSREILKSDKPVLIRFDDESPLYIRFASEMRG